ncbi:outer membrane biogenesis protein BamB [Rubripirellula lacrimiformis]|uniref:Outer membrane biogenesis protein BamB n=1 Tax=Rubripirellula lacrimiformis TaxID=1930273 RepID=A0A517NBD0_9BACT|nr:PQQ-binding-like beta-propeller repeat protein [Rubripirellula lacrimiformis]QDT04430.1 outer membrane biogenesis protein BamB [Rubripirellula lacrimiformis]
MKLLLSIAGTLLFSASLLANDNQAGWPQWRGPDGSGVAVDADPPTVWSENENIHWKIDVPGVGSSTPIILGDRVYVATAFKTDRVAENAVDNAGSSDAAAGDSQRRGSEPSGRRRGGGRGGSGRGGSAPANYYDFMVIAYDRETGSEVWRSTLTSQVPHESGHSTNTFASSSPITDGQQLYISFGSRGVYCMDLDGNKQWSKDLGRMETRNQFGEGSSPAVHNGVMVVPFDHEGQSFIVALDTKSGNEIWRQPRDEQTTWATPLITDWDGRSQVVTNGSNRVRSYDLETGKIIWQCGGQAGNPIPTPVRFEDNVIVMTGYRGYAIYSIPLDSTGDITDTDKVTWYEEDAAPYVSSPVLYQGQLYFLKSNNGVLLSRDAKTGDLLIDQTRLPDIKSVYASPVAAADRIYLTGREGTTLVIKHGKTFEVIATNTLDDEIDASAAIVGGQIFLRSKTHLYCISK